MPSSAPAEPVEVRKRAPAVAPVAPLKFTSVPAPAVSAPRFTSRRPVLTRVRLLPVPMMVVPAKTCVFVTPEVPVTRSVTLPSESAEEDETMFAVGAPEAEKFSASVPAFTTVWPV